MAALTDSTISDGSIRRKITLAESTEATMDPKFNDYKALFSVEEDLMPSLEELPKESTASRPSAATAEEPLESKAEFRKRWLSLGVVYVINFLLVIQNSLYWTSLWPYLSQIDPTATESFFGYVIMIFNLASAIASPMFGYWSNRIQQTRIPIIAGISLTVVGNCLMAFVEDFSSNRKWIIFVARFITGLGLGNQGSIYAYVAMASTLKERNKAIAFRAAVNSVGLMLGPAMQAAFVPIGFPGIIKGKFIFNMYTAPAYVNMGIGILQIIIMLTVFRDYWISVDESQMAKKQEKEKYEKLKPFDIVAVITSIYVRLVILFCFSYDTTIGSPFTMAMFKWTRSEAVTYNSLISISMGVINFSCSILVGTVILKYIRERIMVILGLASFILFYIISFPWPGLPPMIPQGEMGVDFSNATTQAATYPSTISPGSPPTTQETYSCDYVWCSYTTRVNLAQYIVAYLCMVLAFAVAYTPNGTLFSKILGPRKQGTMQGVFAACGQVAMTISPLVCSNLFEFYGPRVTWGTGAAVLASAVILVIVTYGRLIPWSGDSKEPETEKTRLLSRDSQKPDYESSK